MERSTETPDAPGTPDGFDRGAGPDGRKLEVPTLGPLSGVRGFALTVDVEEWYHTCLVPEFVDPQRRPSLPEELDWLLPELLDLLEEAGCRATFFVLGEVAERLPERIAEIGRRGHEIASHGFLHLRAGGRTEEEFRDDLRRSLELLGEISGGSSLGYRAPEWSLRRLDNPKLRTVVEAGVAYDSSLAPVLGAGSLSNPSSPALLRWSDGATLAELPPLTFGGPLSLPAGSWPGRLAGPRVVARAAARRERSGGLAVMVVHPWEISGRPTPGRLRGWARFVHETGRTGYRERFARILGAHPWRPLGYCLGIGNRG